nr:hypothetical protein [Mycoplasmopsis bovis]
MYGHNKENEAKITYDQRKGLNEINVTDYKIIYRMIPKELNIFLQNIKLTLTILKVG